jgi:hypothetical protein
LRESTGPGARTGLITDVAVPDVQNTQEKTWSLEGSVMTCCFTFVFALMTKWITAGSSILSRCWKFMSLGVVVYIAYELVSASTGRQRLRSLRREAIKAIENVLANFEAFDSTSSAAINFIQEVEAVSRGYHL